MVSIRIQNLTQTSEWVDASILRESDEAVVVRTDQMLHIGDAVALEYSDRLALAEVIWVPLGKSRRITLRIEQVLHVGGLTASRDSLRQASQGMLSRWSGYS